MEAEDVKRCWEENAEVWTQLVRAGYDVYRDAFNTPAFLDLLPDVHGLRGLDVGCGEGHNTRLLARRGAVMVAVDVAPTFIRHAETAERADPLGITYREAGASALPFGDASFDFVTAFMSLMDMARLEDVLAEIHRAVSYTHLRAHET